MASKRKHPSVLSYLFHPIIMGVGVVVIGVYFGIQQKETVEIVKQLPTRAKATIFCEKPIQSMTLSTCVDNYVVLDQFVTVVRSEIAPQSFETCFGEQHYGDPEAAWQCLETVDGKPIHKQYKSPLSGSDTGGAE